MLGLPKKNLFAEKKTFGGNFADLNFFFGKAFVRSQNKNLCRYPDSRKKRPRPSNVFAEPKRNEDISLLHHKKH